MRPAICNSTILRAAVLALGIAIASGLAPQAARAQDAPASVPIDVGDCVNLSSPGARFDCYERHVAAAKQPATTAVPALQTNAAPTTAAPTHTDAVPVAPATSASVPAAAATTVAVGAAASAPAVTPSAATAAPPPPTVSAATNAAPPQAAPAATAAASPQPAPATTAAAPPQTVPAATSASVSPQTAPAPSSASAPPEIVATVTDLHETMPNAWQITLDNGQVWRQNLQQRFALKTGQRVTLHATKWGSSYRLTTESLNGFIQVERVR